MDNSIIECNIEAVANNVADIPKAIMRAKILTLLIPQGEWDQYHTANIPSSFKSIHYKSFPGNEPLPRDYTSNEGKIERLKAWMKDPIYDLPEEFVGFQAACESYWKSRNAYYEAQDLSILKKYLDYLVDALI